MKQREEVWEGNNSEVEERRIVTAVENWRDVK